MVMLMIMVCRPELKANTEDRALTMMKIKVASSSIRDVLLMLIAHHLPINQSINQSISQCINESMNEWMNELINQSINQSIVCSDSNCVFFPISPQTKFVLCFAIPPPSPPPMQWSFTTFTNTTTTRCLTPSTLRPNNLLFVIFGLQCNNRKWC